MSNSISLERKIHTARKRDKKIKLRKHLNADRLIKKSVRGVFEKIQDHRTSSFKIPLVDTLMSGFAMFSLKDRSLLAFDERRINSPHSLKAIYGINHIPCDTSIRAILDGMDPIDIRPAFTRAFAQLQRGKVLESFGFIDNSYLVCFDGTGIFSSSKLHSPSCMEKQSKLGDITYYMQMVGAAIVHPDHKEVIPLCPEMIQKQDGQKKNDCERNAIKRLLKHLRKEHPRLLGAVAVTIVAVDIGRDNRVTPAVGHALDPVGSIIGVVYPGSVGVADGCLFGIRGIGITGGITIHHRTGQAVTAVKGIRGGAGGTFHPGAVPIGIICVGDLQTALDGGCQTIKGIIAVLGDIGDGAAICFCLGFGYAGDIVILVICSSNGADSKIGTACVWIGCQSFTVYGVVCIVEALALGIDETSEVALGIIVIGNGEIATFFVLDMLRFAT